VTITIETTPAAAGTVDQRGDGRRQRDRDELCEQHLSSSRPAHAAPPVYRLAVSKVLPKQLFVGHKTTLTIHVIQTPARGRRTATA
jgi:hypothetical protein